MTFRKNEVYTRSWQKGLSAVSYKTLNWLSKLKGFDGQSPHNHLPHHSNNDIMKSLLELRSRDDC